MAAKKTPVFDWEAGDFKLGPRGEVLTATEGDAVKQIALKAQHTARGVYLIYADPEDSDKNHKYGTDVYAILASPGLTEEARLSELQRAIKEALVYDPWITDVYDITVYKQLDDDQVTRYYADYSLKTIYDKAINETGVLLND